LAEWISTPSNPASTALRAATVSSSTMSGTSSVSGSLGTGYGALPLGTCTSPWIAMALGASRGRPPVISSCETRPPCMSCITMRPPSACTASVTRRQPAICSSVTMPGCPGYALLRSLVNTPSETMRPVDARWR
jgi:hypothetical protein